MKNWKTVPIPEKMKTLRTERGYPVPVIIMNDNSGTPQFKINNEKMVEICMLEKLCSICGSVLKNDMWMIGGPMSSFYKHGVYIDIPVHEECGKYALQVCPYLAVSRYTQQVDFERLESGFGTGAMFNNPTQSAERVPFFVFAKTSGYTVRRQGHKPFQQRYIIPNRPFLLVEYWNEGEHITKEEATKLFDRWASETKDFKDIAHDVELI